MKPRKPTSLRKALTRNIIVLQALVLMAFTIVAMVPIMNMIGKEPRLDPKTIELVADAVQRTPDGDLVFEITNKLAKIALEYPAFWFYAADADGHVAQMGNVPEQALLIGGNLTHISSASISDIGDPEAPTAIIRQHAGSAGTLWILTGGGPEISWKLFFLSLSNPIFLGLLVFFTATTMFAVPVFVKRQLRGLESVAGEADLIDVDQRGVRLSPGRVPIELHPLVRAINAALERLDQGMERQKRFMADAAHELRTPIAILQTRLELLSDCPERTRLLLDVARLGSMANQLLDLQRMDLSPQPFETLDLVELASQVTADLAPLAIAAGDEVSFQADTSPVPVMGDRGALSRAITNLVQNAISHAGDNAEITIAVFPDRRLQVFDTGPGIDPNHRDEIFEPFYRVAPLQHGAGLGLSLVRDIIHRHNGRVLATNRRGGGAMFEILLPKVGH